MDVQHTTEATVAPAVVGRMLLARLDSGSVEALRAAVAEDVMEQVKAQAFEQAMAELDDRLQREREKVRDELARYKDRLDGELEDELERRTAQIRREVRDDLEERLLTLQDDLKATTTARDQVQALLMSLVQQLLNEKNKRYLADAHITQLDLLGLNQVLALQGLRVRAEFRHSERQVTCQLKNGVGQRTVFWIETAAPGVAVEGEADYQAETHAGSEL